MKFLSGLEVTDEFALLGQFSNKHNFLSQIIRCSVFIVSKGS